ncbi:MAG: hypothetical protein WBY97_23250 [Roseiarcus sp.]
MIVTLIIVARACDLVLDRWRLRRTQRKDSSDAIAKRLGRATLAVAGEAHKGVGSSLTAAHADLSANREAVASPEREAAQQPRKPEERKRIVSETLDSEQFRIQFLGGATRQGPEILKEVEVCVPNVFVAFRAADDGAWPPGATGFRLLDSRGRDVFWRRRPERR